MLPAVLESKAKALILILQILSYLCRKSIHYQFGAADVQKW